jgi:hypothetical protein
MPLTPETVGKIKLVGKAVAKIKSGGRLSPAEQETLDLLSGEQQYFDSMPAAAAAMNIPLSVLRRAKNAGCPGFRHSRVYPALVLPWLKDRKAEFAKPAAVDQKLNADIRKAIAHAERVEFENKVAQGKYILRSVVRRDVTQSITTAKTRLLGIPASLAPHVVGLSVAEAELRIRNAIDEALRDLSA